MIVQPIKRRVAADCQFHRHCKFTGQVDVFFELNALATICLASDLNADFMRVPRRDGGQCRPSLGRCNHMLNEPIQYDRLTRWLPWDQFTRDQAIWLSDIFPETEEHIVLL